MRLIDNHWQVVSSEKGVEVTSARYHQWRPTKRRSIISRQSKSEIARPFPRATRAAIIGIKAGVNKFRIASNPISLSFAAFAESKAPEERDRSCTSPFVELVQDNSMLKRQRVRTISTSYSPYRIFRCTSRRKRTATAYDILVLFGCSFFSF